MGIVSGMQVILAIAGIPLLVGAIASLFGHFDLVFLAAFPQRVIGIMNNPLLIAIPLFVLMGNLLEKSKQAERMLFNITKLFGDTKSTLALAVLAVSALIASSTGIIGATIVMLGMIALPSLLKAGVPENVSSGLICASGTLGQIIPPSIVLILLGDQISNAYIEAQQSAGNFAPDPVTVGDLFAGALLPGLLLVALYGIYVVFALMRAERRRGNARADDHKSTLTARQVGALLAQILPVVLLILAVLGSILIGVGTPTEAAAIGVAGTTLIAAYNLDGVSKAFKRAMVLMVVVAFLLVILQRIGYTKIDFSSGNLMISPQNWLSIIPAVVLGLGAISALVALWRRKVLQGALVETCHISAMIFGIIIAASMLSLVFRGMGGDKIVEELLTALPGDQWAMLGITMLVIFLLGFVLDFVEITFIVIPIVGPAILQADIDPVWFAILIALNIQTSFLTPPFGFALFYFRSVAPAQITTRQIYRSIVPFVVLQIVALGLVALFPALATWLPGLLFR
jgi:tripartite ATP-independent transporter DctM subunit